MQNLIIGTIPTFIAFIVSLILYKKLDPKWFQLFTWFLLIILLVQYIGYGYSAVLKDGNKPRSNHFIFNIETFIEYGFYILIYNKAIIKKKAKILAFITGCLFIVIYIYEIFFVGSFFIYNTEVIIISCILTLFVCILYLAELFMAEEFINFFTIPLFWITTGIMISEVGIFLYSAFFNFILKYNLDPHGLVYEIIFTSLSIIQYSLFAIGFLCKNLWKKTS